MISVIPNTFYRHTSGRTASLWGSCPWHSERERSEWQTVTDGFTWQNDNGTIGLGRVPAKSREEADRIAREWNNREHAARIASEDYWREINAPVAWSRVKGNDGSVTYHSGEGYSIRKIGAWFVCEDSEATSDLPAYRNLARAKSWCLGGIRRNRQDRLHLAATAETTAV